MADILDQAWQLSPEAFANSVGEETVLLHIRRNTYYGLDPIGTRIWQGLGDGRSPRDISSEIAEEHDVPLDQVEEDTRKFLEDLRANEIIVPA